MQNALMEISQLISGKESSLTDLLKHVQKPQYQAWQAIEAQAAMRSARMVAMQEQMRLALSPTIAMQEQIRRALAPIAAMQEQMRQVAEPWSTMQQQMHQAIKALQQETLHTGDQKFADGIALQNEFSKIPTDAIREAERDIEQASQDPTLQETVARLITVIEAQQHPALKVLLWLYFKKALEILLSAWLGAVVGIALQDTAGSDIHPREDAKTIRTTAQKMIVSVEALSEFRYVAAPILIVRQNPKARSPEISRFPFGTAVKVLEKGKDFYLIEWHSQDDKSEVQGWVFARYLSKFN